MEQRLFSGRFVQQNKGFEAITREGYIQKYFNNFVSRLYRLHLFVIT